MFCLYCSSASTNSRQTEASLDTSGTGPAQQLGCTDCQRASSRLFYPQRQRHKYWRCCYHSPPSVLFGFYSGLWLHCVWLLQ